MRILHVFKTYYPDSFGGIEQVIHEISARSSPLFEHTLLTIGNCKVIQHERQEGLRVIRLPKQGELLSTPWARDGLRQFKLAVDAADVVHYHAPWPMIDYWHYLAPPKKPTVLTYHADVTKAPWLAKLYAIMQRRTLSRVDAVVATSPNLLGSSSVLQSLQQSVHVIPLGLTHAPPLSEVEQVNLLRLLSLPQQPFILFVGSLRPYKGIQVALDAACVSGVPLVIVGDGPTRTVLQRSLPRDAPVTFLGSVTDQEKQALIARCAALVLPSINRAEAFGLVLLEAAMQAKPQISTALGTATSWVNIHGVTGWVVPPSDVTALAAAMREVVDQPVLAKERGLASWERWHHLFQGSIMVDAYERLYEDLLTRSVTLRQNQ